MDLFGDDSLSSADELFDSDDDLLAPEQGAAATQEEFTHPRQSTFLLGHDKTEKALIDNIINEQMPHAIVLAGAKGIGKATLAYRLARYVLKHGIGQGDSAQDALFGGDEIAAEITSLNVPADDPVFSRVASGGHPDLMSIERQYDEQKNRRRAIVDVAEIRKATPFLRLTASAQGGWRVVVVDDADTMNRNAQNALLKILEEPPPRTLLILVAHRLGALIPTIRSRVRVFSIKPLAGDVMMELINKRFPALPLQERENLMRMASGSFGEALRYQEQGGLETLGNLLESLRHYPDLNWQDIHAMADELGRPGNDEAFALFRDVMLWIVGESLKQKARGNNKAQQSANALPPAFEKIPLSGMIKICETLQELYNRALNANLDKRQAVLSSYARLSEMAG